MIRIGIRSTASKLNLKKCEATKGIKPIGKLNNLKRSGSSSGCRIKWCLFTDRIRLDEYIEEQEPRWRDSTNA